MAQKVFKKSVHGSNLTCSNVGDRLKAEVEKKDVEHEERVAVLQSRHAADLKDLQAQLQEAEAARQSSHDEVSVSHTSTKSHLVLKRLLRFVEVVTVVA